MSDKNVTTGGCLKELGATLLAGVCITMMAGGFNDTLDNFSGKSKEKLSVLDEFKKQNKELFVKTDKGVEYIPTKEADSLYDLSNYFEEINNTRMPVLSKDNRAVLGFKYQ